MTQAVLEIRGLRVTFPTPDGVFPAVDGVDLMLHEGETLCVVGESGCGKSMTALSILRLLPQSATVESGEVLYRGKNLLNLVDEELRSVRGDEIAMIFQEPMTSLNPVFTVGNQIEEVLQVHTSMDRGARRKRVIELLELVGIPAPVDRLMSYPHQLSGGMRQRVMIAMALACNPSVLIADEPTTALDVTIQAQILELLEELKTKLGMAVLLITHDLGVVAETAQQVAVLYAGRVVETADVKSLFRAPRHPYTEGLLRAMPGVRTKQRELLHVIPGSVPDLVGRPVGCSFRDRCAGAEADCAEVDPVLKAVDSSRSVACHHPVADSAE